jgi:quercetin dioxygenase-like cupin family protein
MAQAEIDTDPVSLLVDGALLLAEAKAAVNGRAARTLIRIEGAPLRQTLVALKEGAVLSEHESPESASIQIIAGEVRLHAGDLVTVLSHGELVPVPAGRHWVDAVEDAILLLTVAVTRPG